MTASRLLAGLIQSLVALLLLAAPGDLIRVSDDRLLRAVESVGKGLPVSRERAGIVHPVLGEPDCLDGDDDPEPAIVAPGPGLPAPDLARLIRVSRAGFATAPPSHRPCAAPPTGPPLA